jgi:hypothetical protein
MTANRFNHLLEPAPDLVPSPSPATGQDGRPRLGSLSQKRKSSNDGMEISYASIAAGNDTEIIDSDTDNDAAFLELTKVRSLSDKIAVDISESNADVSVLSIFSTINEAISGLCTVMSLKCKPKQKPVQNTMVNLGAVPKRAKVTGMTQSRQVSNPTPVARNYIPTVTQSIRNPESNPGSGVKPEIQGFHDAVKAAEKSTLVFNLNMGKVPIINTDTMSKRATKSLLEMAAVAEGRTADNPSGESVAIIDDILSVSTGISFFGSTTKTYRNPKDKTNSKAYCTVPVKYDFNDKDTRIRVEQLLRTHCKINCTTP